jgi:fluoride ion exporter CrcB/FEX
VGYLYLIEQVFENLPQGCLAGVKTMSTVTVNRVAISNANFSATASKTLINQGFLAATTTPSGYQLNRGGRLARTLVVLSLAVVMLAVFGFQAGAEVQANTNSKADSFITIVVAPGESLWSLAGRLGQGGDTRELISEIISINSLATPDVEAGQRLRIPLTR